MQGRTALGLGWLLALLLAGCFVSLGLWQHGRMQQKQAMLDAVAQVIVQRQAQSLSIAADPTRSNNYDWAGGDGKFADAPALLLDNQLRDGQPGVRVYRLFLPDATPGNAAITPLLVDMGWLALGAKREMPILPAITGTHSIAGLLTAPPSPGLLDAPPQTQADGSLLLMRIAPQALADTLHTPAIAARVLKLDPALTLGHPRDLDILPNTLPPEKHLGYAVQWFALALAVLLIAAVLTYRAWRRRRLLDLPTSQ